MEGHYIEGFGDGSAPVTASEPILVRSEIVEELTQQLELAPETRRHLAKTMRAVEGFESQYSLELLVTVHWVMAHDRRARMDPHAAYEEVRGWSKRKQGLFTEEHIATAWHAIRDRKLLSS